MTGRKRGGASAAEPRLVPTLGSDLRTVWGACRGGGLRRSLGRTLDDLEAFYLSEERQQRLRPMGRVKRALWLGWYLLKGLLLKLTPVRRVLLAVALVFLVSRVSWRSGDAVAIGVDLPAAGTALLLLLLMLELKDKLLARDELEAGRAVQHALLPEREPRLAGWELWLSTQPANEVGGDLVDVIRLERGPTALVLADVSGKGLGAALLAARLQASVRLLADDLADLARLGQRLNRAFRQEGLGSSFATLVYLEIEPGSGRVRLLNAGHMPPLVVRAGAVDDGPRGEAALGVLADTAYREQTLELGPGEALVVCSDGVTEAQEPGGQFFGGRRLRETVARLGAGPASTIAGGVLDEVVRFTADAPWRDDLSLLVVKRNAQAGWRRSGA